MTWMWKVLILIYNINCCWIFICQILYSNKLMRLCSATTLPLLCTDREQTLPERLHLLTIFYKSLCSAVIHCNILGPFLGEWDAARKQNRINNIIANKALYVHQHIIKDGLSIALTKSLGNFLIMSGIRWWWAVVTNKPDDKTCDQFSFHFKGCTYK